MHTIAFTGSSSCEAEAKSVLERALAEHSGQRYVSGAQFGVDTFVAQLAWSWFPEAEHVLCIPAAPHNEELAAWARKHGFIIVPCTPGSNRSRAYMNRNDELVGLADVLIAVPENSAELWRGSGTWATVRRARKKGIPVHIYPLHA